ncbi:hypothetical protein F4802DRAFT_580896 [Xylaria palmicola]|nr:hypothetical protein F4802DRAFT_580896 [Xylaria palmicola]
MASSPYKPDDEERDSYFHGFSGSPTLVARTGHNRWTKPPFETGWAVRACPTSSYEGDSGSAIFDIDGNVVAIFTASNGVADETPGSGTDITFAAPIQWVLDDTRGFTGQQVRLA